MNFDRHNTLAAYGPCLLTDDFKGLVVRDWVEVDDQIIIHSSDTYFEKLSVWFTQLWFRRLFPQLNAATEGSDLQQSDKTKDLQKRDIWLPSDEKLAPFYGFSVYHVYQVCPSHSQDAMAGHHDTPSLIDTLAIVPHLLQSCLSGAWPSRGAMIRILRLVSRDMSSIVLTAVRSCTIYIGELSQHSPKRFLKLLSHARLERLELNINMCLPGKCAQLTKSQHWIYSNLLNKVTSNHLLLECYNWGTLKWLVIWLSNTAVLVMVCDLWSFRRHKNGLV